MKTLFLVRHAKSDKDLPGLADFDRPLNKRGKENALMMAERFAKRAIPVDALISSPAVRARSTADFFARAIANKGIILQPDIYDAGLFTLLHLVNALPNDQHAVMLFGHNPGFSQLASNLSNEVLEMPTCAMAEITFSADNWNDVEPGKGTLVSFDYPKNPSTK